MVSFAGIEKAASTTNNYTEMKAVRFRRETASVRVRGNSVTSPKLKMEKKKSNGTSNSPLMGLDKSRPDSHHWTDGEAT